MVLSILVITLTLAVIASCRLMDLSHNHNAKVFMSFYQIPSYNRTRVVYGTGEVGIFCDSGWISSGEHGGTHMDAPSHLVEGSRLTLENIPLEDTIADGVMIDCFKEAQENSEYGVPLQKLLDWEKEHGKIPQNAAVLFFFGWDRNFHDQALYRGTSDFLDYTTHRFPYVSEEAGMWLLEKRDIKIIGSDTMSPDPMQINGIVGTFPIHVQYLPRGRLIIENLATVGQLPPRNFRFHAAPVKFVGASGTQVRAFAMTYDDPLTNPYASKGNKAQIVMFPFIFLSFLCLLSS